MTARSTDPVSMARSAKRRDTTPKAGKSGKSWNKGSVAEARRYSDTGTAAQAAAVSPTKPLTEKQMLFVRHWAQGETIRTAAIRAGYADGGQMAYRMVHMPNVLRLYEAEKAKYEAAAHMSRKKVMDMLQEAYDMAKLMAEPASMVSAAREIGKMCGYYAPVEKRISITGNVVMEKLNKLSDQELLNYIEGTVEATDALDDEDAAASGEDE